MNKITEALKLAEEALNNERTVWAGMNREIPKIEQALAAIREALAEPVQEPVALRKSLESLVVLVNEANAAETQSWKEAWFKGVDDAIERILCKYAAPVSAKREWVELTDYEIVRLYDESPMCDSEMIAFARAAIAAFKEKNK